MAVATAAGTFATTGRLIRWLPEASPHRALAATIAVAVLAITADTAVIGTYLVSSRSAQLLAAIAISASLIRITCSLLTIRTATALRTRTASAHTKPTETQRFLPR